MSNRMKGLLLGILCSLSIWGCCVLLAYRLSLLTGISAVILFVSFATLICSGIAWMIVTAEEK